MMISLTAVVDGNMQRDFDFEMESEQDASLSFKGVSLCHSLCRSEDDAYKGTEYDI